jgi:GlpG protein
MRLIGTLEEEQKGLTFSLFLHQQGINHQLEILSNTDWGSPDYGSSKCQIWILDEDQVDEALKWYHLFLENPHDPVFDVIRVKKAPLEEQTPLLKIPETAPPISPRADDDIPDTPWKPQPMGPITRLLLLTCCLLFFMNYFIIPKGEVPDSFPSTPLFSSPIEKVVLYDYPKAYQIIDKLIQLYGYEALQAPQDLPAEGRFLVQQFYQTPYWQGVYYTFIKEHPNQSQKSPPMFEKIRQGEIWRLFSPILFHGDLFHLFFNMLWLVVLGKQIESRLAAWKYLVLIAVLALFSNTAQYLMSGPNFIGFSGVLCGMLTFIMVRKRIAAWEGYQLDQMTISFMLLFIIGMAFLQLFSFLLESSAGFSFSTGIANTAHLSGALLGFLLGYLNFFNWKQA